MFFRSIHYLRAFAALVVVLYHAFIGTAPAALAGGVDVFFVISGFVMVEATRSGFDPRRFLAARAIRILPPYWIACALASVVVVTTPLRDWFLIPEAKTLWDWPIPEPFLSPGWTLAYEALFYLVFALCLGRWWLASGVLIALALLGTAWQSVVTNPLVVEFAFGMAIASLPRHVLARHAGPLLGIALFGFLLATRTEAIPVVVRWWVLGVPAAALVAGLVGFERRIPESRVLHFLGSASYSIYLVHMLPMVWVSHWSGFVLGTAAGCLMYLTLEQPTLRALRGLMAGLRDRRQRLQTRPLY